MVPWDVSVFPTCASCSRSNQQAALDFPQHLVSLLFAFCDGLLVAFSFFLTVYSRNVDVMLPLHRDWCVLWRQNMLSFEHERQNRVK